MSDYYSDLDACYRAGLDYAMTSIAYGDTVPLDATFSGEWADGLTGQDVLDAAGIRASFDLLEDFEQSDVLDAWEDGYYSADWPGGVAR